MSLIGRFMNYEHVEAPEKLYPEEVLSDGIRTDKAEVSEGTKTAQVEERELVNA